jgi:eukaryotic-like serine/threonine-protein kinase
MREHDPDAGQTVRILDRLTGAVLDGRYRVDEKIAAGGFGAIYRATDLVMGREVALKTLHNELASDASIVERFRREADVLAKLRDPHTITMYDAGESRDGTRYIVMELLRGRSLHELFYASGKRLPWPRVVAIARGVCSSLREAHTLGVVHRDLKPANIHLEPHAIDTDFVKVLDFGIAKMIDASESECDLTHVGQMVGTFDYMPPEQMIGGLCTGKGDVFTLGVVIYEMIAGERPYGEATGPASRLMTLLGSTPVSLGLRAVIPAELDRIVVRALERDPELRPDIFELDATLARVLDAAAGHDDARFADEDGPTWIEVAKPARITPLRTPAPTRAPVNQRLRMGATMLHSAATMTPSHGVPIPPRTPARTPPSARLASGTDTQVPPAPATEPRVVPVYVPQPVRVRFATPPARMPVGTTSPVRQEPSSSALWKRHARAAFLRGMIYAALLVAVAAAIYVVTTAA